MKREETISMKTQDIDRMSVIQAVLEKRLKQRQAAKRLDISTRQVRRLSRRLKREGARGLLHGLRGRPSNHRLATKELSKGLRHITKLYADFGPTLAHEKLRKIHQIKLSLSRVRRGMIAEGLWTPSREGKRHRAWRERRSSVGELVQLDGSDHDWFEGRGPRCALLIFIDDATSRILYGQFVTVEDTLNLLGATRNYLRLHGRPVAFYVDRDSIYKVNRQATVEEELKDAEPLTQFTRAMGELTIGMIFAMSPQAKGRVERGFRTHQDRLVKELRLAGISTMEEANEFLRDVYMPDHNRRCAVAPAHPGDAHRPLLRGHCLAEILSVRVARGVAQDFTIRYQNQFFQILAEQKIRVRPGNSVEVETRLDGSLHLRFKGVYLRFKALPHRPARPSARRVPRPAHPRPGTLEYARRVRLAA
jgi:transposase